VTLDFSCLFYPCCFFAFVSVSSCPHYKKRTTEHLPFYYYTTWK